MSGLLKMGSFTIDGSSQKQKMSGFGVNINSKYWNDGEILPVMEMLVDDLKAKLFRLDVYGRSDWIDEDGTLGKEKALFKENLEKVYNSKFSRYGWGMIRYLNERGIEPYITSSGIIPKWMADETGKLTDYESFCAMLISFLDWALNKEKLRFCYYCPLNETDLGPPEGPWVGPEEYVDVCRLLEKMLIEKGFNDIKLVVTEQAFMDTRYLKAFAAAPELADRVGVFSFHQYDEYTTAQYDEMLEQIEKTYKGKLLWMGEYGDLDQTGEIEWPVAWRAADRALSFVKGGFDGGIQWDAFDNYHDHDDSWTIYGLIRFGNNWLATPKKRYYSAKQLFRFIQPGYVNVNVEGSSESIKILAFLSPDGKDISVVGMNHSSTAHSLNLHFTNLHKVPQKMNLFTTTEKDNCVKQPSIRFSSHDKEHALLTVPPESIFTLTTLT